ncbi:MAG: bifunctional Delta(1)-pyrroline-2-carboxylate/Delta(1)-piperideine-2-carboxylate reductase [Burkholderiaceae bacterium]
MPNLAVDATPRFFTAEQVHQSLTFGALADAIADMLRARPAAPLRHAHALSATDTLLVMPAWSDGESGALGVKLVTVMPGNRERNRATVNAIYVLFDRDSGALRAVIDGESLTLCRTAAASLLAARHLARADADNVLIVGTGRLAPYMARAHCHERKVTRLRVWGRNGVGAQTLAQMLRDEGLPAQAVDDLEQAVREADIVSCATTATAPVVHGAWLPAGCHLDLVGGFRRGMREVDDAAVVRSRVYVDTYAGALAEAADIVEPLGRGVIARGDVRGELAELVRGDVPGRTSSNEITLFKSVGTAVEDLAAAQLLLRNTAD